MARRRPAFLHTRAAAIVRLLRGCQAVRSTVRAASSPARARPARRFPDARETAAAYRSPHDRRPTLRRLFLFAAARRNAGHTWASPRLRTAVFRSRRRAHRRSRRRRHYRTVRTMRSAIRPVRAGTERKRVSETKHSVTSFLKGCRREAPQYHHMPDGKSGAVSFLNEFLMGLHLFY